MCRYISANDRMIHFLFTHLGSVFESNILNSQCGFTDNFIRKQSFSKFSARV